MQISGPHWQVGAMADRSVQNVGLDGTGAENLNAQVRRAHPGRADPNLVLDQTTATEGWRRRHSGVESSPPATAYQSTVRYPAKNPALRARKN